ADVLFDFDKADVKPAADASLTELVTVIKSYPDATIDVEGHTDGKGADAYNQSLSERRATAVATWLIAHGNLQPSRVRTRGWGKAKPIAPITNRLPARSPRCDTGASSTQVRPPCSATSSRTTDRPMPVPATAEPRSRSSRQNRSQMRSRSAAGIPGPSSSTETRARPSARVR